MVTAVRVEWSNTRSVVVMGMAMGMGIGWVWGQKFRPHDSPVEY